MKTKTLSQIINRIRSIEFNQQYDLIVGIGNGGIVPAYLVHSHLKVPLDYLWINFRNDNHQPTSKYPKLTRPIPENITNKKILIVDDRSNTGATLKLAKKLLNKAKLVETLVVNGQADYSLFNEPCFHMPWDIEIQCHH